MAKRVHIVISLLSAASKLSINQLKEEILNEAKIPWCNEIEDITLDDNEESYFDLKKQGISSTVAQNLMDLYTEK